MPFYLTPKQDDFNKIPELQICIAEALYALPLSEIVFQESTVFKQKFSDHCPIAATLEIP